MKIPTTIWNGINVLNYNVENMKLQVQQLW